MESRHRTSMSRGGVSHGERKKREGERDGVRRRERGILLDFCSRVSALHRSDPSKDDSAAAVDVVEAQARFPSHALPPLPPLPAAASQPPPHPPSRMSFSC